MLLRTSCLNLFVFCAVIFSFQLAAQQATPVYNSIKYGEHQILNERRVALVIGNSAYQDSPLKNPVNDAKSIAEALRQFDFEVIELVDQSRISMHRAIQKFGHKLKEADVGLFYYAGHGMQVKGKNYLLPVDSDILAEDDVPYYAIDANEVLAKMQSANNPVNIVILDACRNNPYSSPQRSFTRGLARIDAPVGSLIVYSSAPGQVAADGDGYNGLFTSYLLKHMATPERNIRDVIMATRLDVMNETDGEQVPWESSSLTKNFFLAKGYSEQSQTEPNLKDVIIHNASDVNPAIRTIGFSEELEMWKVVRNSNDAGELEAFLHRFENGLFASVAADKLKAISDRQEVKQKRLFIDTYPGDASIELLNELQAYHYGMSLAGKKYQVKVRASGYQTKTTWLDLNDKQTFYVNLQKTEQKVELKIVGQKYNINNVSFHMKDIPAGVFMMGDQNKVSESPYHSVVIKAFQLMETEITWALYQHCINSGKCEDNAESGGDRGWGKGERPVIGVSWLQIKEQFIPWLNQQTGQVFRLPSEAEWEYSARAGTTTTYSWGNRITCDHARYNGGINSSCYYKKEQRHYLGTATVRSYKPNAFGLYDMHGNVGEWVQDCRNKSYRKASKTGKPNLSGDCEKRIVRGGSWFVGGSKLTSSTRDRGTANKQYREIGFRLAKSI